jgi:hypothetical protein
MGNWFPAQVIDEFLWNLENKDDGKSEEVHAITVVTSFVNYAINFFGDY